MEGLDICRDDVEDRYSSTILGLREKLCDCEGDMVHLLQFLRLNVTGMYRSLFIFIIHCSYVCNMHALCCFSFIVATEISVMHTAFGCCLAGHILIIQPIFQHAYYIGLRKILKKHDKQIRAKLLARHYLTTRAKDKYSSINQVTIVSFSLQKFLAILKYSVLTIWTCCENMTLITATNYYYLWNHYQLIFSEGLLTLIDSLKVCVL